MAERNSNLSTATSPQTQAALQSLMQQELAMKLQDRQANLQLKMQEKQLDDQFQTRQHERKLQQEQMKFQNSAAGQQRQHEMQMQQKQNEQWDKKNKADQETALKVQAAENTARERAASIEWKRQLELRDVALQATAADSTSREGIQKKITEIREKGKTYAQAKIAADIQWQLKNGATASSLANFFAKHKAVIEKQDTFLRDAGAQASTGIATILAGIESGANNEDLLRYAPEKESYWQGVKRTLRGTKKGGIEGSKDASAASIPLVAGLFDDEALPSEGINPAVVAGKLAKKFAEPLATAYGKDTESMRQVVETLFQAGYMTRSGVTASQEEAKNLIKNFMTQRGESAKIDPVTLTAIAETIGKSAEGQLAKVRQTMNDMESKANKEDQVADSPENMEYQKLKSYAAFLEIASNADNVLEASGMRASSQEQKEMMEYVAQQIEQATTFEEKARIARVHETKLKNIKDTDQDTLSKALKGVAEYEEYEERNRKTEMDLSFALQEATIQAEERERTRSTASLQTEQRLLRELASR